MKNPRIEISAEELLTQYREGLIVPTELYVYSIPVLTQRTIGSFLSVLKGDQIASHVRDYSHPSLALPDTDPNDVHRVHAALRAWLADNPEYIKDCDPSFDPTGEG